jgi:hypothetical protein
VPENLTHVERHFDLNIGRRRPAPAGTRAASAAVSPAAWAALGALLGDGAPQILAVLPGWIDRVFPPVPNPPPVLPPPPGPYAPC